MLIKMNHKIKKIFTNVRFIILLSFIILAVIAINPRPFAKGIAINNIITNSSASSAGFAQPGLNIMPVSRERILEINNAEIDELSDFYTFTSNLSVNQSIQIKTNKKLYRIIVREKFETLELNETELKKIEKIVKVNKTINGTLREFNETLIETIEVPKTIKVSKGPEDIGIRITEVSKTNIRKGLDLQGGSRVLLQPEQILTPLDMATLIDSMMQRLNVYGLTDILISDASDLSGNQYILLEIAGANEEEIRNLLAREGKFEGIIGNKTVFKGGKDITFVCKTPDCSGIDPNVGCRFDGNSWICPFIFTITLSLDAAEKMADATKDISISSEDSKYLNTPIEFYLDDVKVDQLNIAASLKGKSETNIQISGSGIGATQEEAVYTALNNMKRLQTVLITGSLPVKLNIVKIDIVSPILGVEFVKNSLFIGLLALISVSALIFLRYRKIEVALPMIFISVSELIILLGVAALIGWNMDLAAVAGIIVAIGTGIDHQILITDETLRGEEKVIFNWKERIKNAFFIIILSYLTLFVAMIPLIFAGGGILKGFAITTIIGASIGVFISRPVYAKMVEILIKD